MPRILRIHNRLITGGPVFNVLNLTKFLEPDFETMLVVGEKERHEQDAGFIAEKMGVKTVLLPEMGRSIHPWKDYTTFKKLCRIIEEFKPDIVHTHAAKPGTVGRLAAHHMKVPVIVHTFHGHVFHSYFGKTKTRMFLNIERYLAKRSTAIIAISDEQRHELVDVFKVGAADKFHIIPLGFELSKFQENALEKRMQFRSEFSLEEDEIAIGIIGRLVPVKNHDLFLEAFAHLRANTSKKVRAFIVGDGVSNPHIQAKAIALGIPYCLPGENHFDRPLIFTSWRSDIDVVNAGLDLVCLTSLNEGTPVSLIEAQAAGRPVLSTNVGGVRNAIVANETGLLADLNNNQSYFSQLASLVENDELRKCMGAKGVQAVSEKFGVSRLSADFRKLYNTLLEKSGR